jgi:UDP-4-amino-4-deoxy-L-arabinose formyltransferase/UDP-glucuronic acid dehydrogenase (UDP-4-keto-hexauronic acid decarboxylating)
VKAIVLAYHNMGLAGLAALGRHGFDIAAVFTHEDDPKENCWFGSVKDWAEKQGIGCTTDPVNSPQWIEKIKRMQPDVLFSFYYRNMVRPEVLAIPRIGSFNLHGSLLPSYRGRCPVNWVLVNGEKETGVTLHCMVEKPDAGDIVGRRAVSIDFEDTARTLYDKLCEAAGGLLDELLPEMKKGKIPRIKQDLSRGSYYGGRKPEDGRISWDRTAVEIYNLIRAVTDPYPGAFAFAENGGKILIWRARPVSSVSGGGPGDVILDGQSVLVKTGDGAIRLQEIEASGARWKDAGIGNYFKQGKVKKLT